ncbi:MAG: 50S ribosomal protein L23 [Patescibacteria group bacterium]
MAILKPKKNTTKKEAPVTKSTKTVEEDTGHHELVLLRPRITEKASLSSTQHVYVFDISLGANKRDVSKAIMRIYSVTPKQVRIVPVPSKQVFVRGKWGVKKGGRKAYVYLNKEDKIEII